MSNFFEVDGDASLLSLGRNGPFHWPAGHVAEIWDLYLPARSKTHLHLEVMSGTADFGLALFDSRGAVFYTTRDGARVLSDTGGPGGDEGFSFVPTRSDWYGVAVWANNVASASYEITVSTPGWDTVVYENFQDSFPTGLWRADGDIRWGNRYRDTTYGFAYPYAGDTLGQPWPGLYPPDLYVWMTYGPFSLADADSAYMQFYRWLDCEETYDYLFWGYSTDGNQYYGYNESGRHRSWQCKTLDLEPACGSSRVWIGWLFNSNGSISDTGPAVDNVLVLKWVPTHISKEPTRLNSTPRDAFLYPGRPSHFRQAVELRYTLGKTGVVKLDVCDASGRLVKRVVDERQPQGVYRVRWNGRDALGRRAPAGIYFVRLETDNHQATRKIVKLE